MPPTALSSPFLLPGLDYLACVWKATPWLLKMILFFRGNVSSLNPFG